MAKKQTIILTHGSSAPTTATTGYVQGEVLVQHGNDALNTALHTLDENGNWVTFPSKDWVNTEIGKLEIGSVNGEINALKGRVEITEGEIDALQEFMTETVPGTYATKEQLSGETSARETAISGLTEIVNTKAAQTDLNTAVDRISVIEGSDAGSSMRKVAAEEVKKLEDMLYGTGATEAIDTLKDVIEWIGEDNSGAGEIISDIVEIKGTISGYTSQQTIASDINALKGRVEITEGEIDALQGFMTETVPGTYATKAELSGETTERKTAISGLTEIVNTKAAQTDLNTAVDRISTAEGKITALETFKDETVPATYATKEQLSGETSARETAISGLTEIVNTKAAQSGLTAAEERISVIEGAYAKTITYSNGNGGTTTLNISNNNIDLTQIIIDGGTY